MDRSLMKRKLRWNSQFQAQSSSQERSKKMLKRDAAKANVPFSLVLRL
jgi:hypothetical protein